MPMSLLATPSDGESDTYRQLKITAERLADLNISRSHAVINYEEGFLHFTTDKKK